MKVLVPYDGGDLSEQAAEPEGATEAQASLDDATERLAKSPAAVTPLLALGRPFAFTSFEHDLQFESAPEAYNGRQLDRPLGFPSSYEGFAWEGVTVPTMAREP